jgi:hypothetical protein
LIFNNLRKQYKIAQERPEVLVQTQSNYFEQKKGISLYLRHYWVVLESFTLSFACGTKNSARNIWKNFFLAKFNLGLIFQYLKIWSTAHLCP